MFPAWSESGQGGQGGQGGSKRGGRYTHPGKDSWTLEWLDDSTFKLELEEQSLNDDGMQEWCQWMDRQLQLTFPNGAHRNLVAAKCRTQSCPDGVKILVAYLLRKNISVHQLKLYRNAIGDVVVMMLLLPAGTEFFCAQGPMDKEAMGIP
ncbi:hypothetical protein AK812_SmicGene31250 [Symbiodinium microadriaticum]|uniref:Uncharacterized protein n=1 Tax=Symbiodinium microadriaticum TaxID=2951 RepID=A0A1Q9CXC7_SYMMI|nr:hypothetical protein AK812_SmicGene31250 [Symbiodinium microadriaticum]